MRPKTSPMTPTAGDREEVSSPEPSNPTDSDYTGENSGRKKGKSQRRSSKKKPRGGRALKKSAAERPFDAKLEPDQHGTDYEAEIHGLNLRLEEQETNIKNSQETISRLIKKADPVALPDNIVYSKLEMIESSWRPFAKKWALASLSGLDPSLNRHVIGIGAVNADSENIARLVRRFQRIPAAPSILLNTLIAHFIHKEIFDRPFFNLIPKIRECFESALDMIKKGEHRILYVTFFHSN